MSTRNWYHVQGEGAGFDDSVPWLTKIPATRTTAGRSWIPKVTPCAKHVADRSDLGFYIMVGVKVRVRARVRVMSVWFLVDSLRRQCNGSFTTAV